MDFNKPSISKKIEKFLLDNLKTEKEKESLINVTTGKSVLKCDAIALLITIVQAMTIADEADGEEFTVSPAQRNATLLLHWNFFE